MWFLVELIEPLVEACLHCAPRPIRYGCTAILLLVAMGLLGLALWAAFK